MTLPAATATYFRVPACKCIVDISLDYENKLQHVHRIFDLSGQPLRLSEAGMEKLRTQVNCGQLQFLPAPLKPGCSKLSTRSHRAESGVRQPASAGWLEILPRPSGDYDGILLQGLRSQKPPTQEKINFEQAYTYCSLTLIASRNQGHMHWKGINPERAALLSQQFRRSLPWWQVFVTEKMLVRWLYATAKAISFGQVYGVPPT